MTIGPSGHAPIDEIGIESLRNKIRDDAAALFQVQDVRAIDERVNEDERCLILWLGIAFVMKEFEAIFLVNDFGRRDPFFDFFGALPKSWKIGHATHGRKALID